MFLIILVIHKITTTQSDFLAILIKLQRQHLWDISIWWYTYTGIFDPKRSGAKGFHEGIFDDGFGGFSTLRKRNLRNLAVKRRPEMDPRGFDGDAFTGDAWEQRVT